MAGRGVIFPPAELKKLLDAGKTHPEIADLVYQRTGHKVTRSAVTQAISRAGLSRKDPKRYVDTLPWTVRTQHAPEYPARMLRLLGRVREGQKLSPDDQSRLDAWREKLERDELYVVYAPFSNPGFRYIRLEDGWEELTRPGPEGVPIRLGLRKPEIVPEDE